MQPQMIADYECVVGEGPLWHPGEQRVYWTDIATGRMFRYDPAADAHEQFYQGEIVGGFTVQDDRAAALHGARGAVKIWRWRMDDDPDDIIDERESRFNDVFADRRPRFLGRCPRQLGQGVSTGWTDRTLTLLLLEGIGVSNGMGLTPDRKQLYFTDTGAGKIICSIMTVRRAT